MPAPVVVAAIATLAIGVSAVAAGRSGRPDKGWSALSNPASAPQYGPGPGTLPAPIAGSLGQVSHPLDQCSSGRRACAL